MTSETKVPMPTADVIQYLEKSLETWKGCEGVVCDQAVVRAAIDSLAQASQARTDGGERARFEQWMLTQGYGSLPNICSEGSPCAGEYANQYWHRSWVAWLAAKSNAAQATQAVSEPVAGLSMAQDPKYTVNGSAIVNRASGEAIPADEPVFIFRARDRHALKALREYADWLPPHTDHWRAVVARHGDFDRFAADHPERMKEPDTHPAPASASEPLQAMADNERELGLDYGLGASASVAGAGEAQEPLTDGLSPAAFMAMLLKSRADLNAMEEKDWNGMRRFANIVWEASLAASPVADGEAIKTVMEAARAFTACHLRCVLADAQQRATLVNLTEEQDKFEAIVRAALARQAPAPLSQAVPEGWVIVPNTATHNMLNAANAGRKKGRSNSGDIYRAMIKAAPQPQAVTEDARDGERLADQIVREVSELGDRSSPEDWPEAMLVTAEELRQIVVTAVKVE